MGRSNKKKHKRKDKRRKDAGSGGVAENKNDHERKGSSPGGSGRSGSDEHRAIYGRYKEATRSFRDGLARLLPVSFPLTSVSDLGNAVEHLLQKSSRGRKGATPPVGMGLLSCLNLTIKLRGKITASAGGDSDEGHAYMNGMLRYCRDVLRECRKIYVASTPKRDKSTDDSGEANPDILGGQFGALSMHDGEGGEESEEDVPDCAPAERPSEPDREYSIEKDLIQVDDLNVRMYIIQINGCLDMMDYQLGRLKGKLDHFKSHPEITKRDLDTAIPLLVMSYSACVNLALEEVKFLEESLVAESPQFKTFYHVIAAIVFGGAIKELEHAVDPDVLAKKPHVVLDFVAKEVENGFRSPSDPAYFDMPRRAQAFAKKANVSIEKEKVVEILFLVTSLTFLEVIPKSIIRDNSDTQELIATCRKNRDEWCRSRGIPPSDVSKMWELMAAGRYKIVNAPEGRLAFESMRDVLHIQSMLQIQARVSLSIDDKTGMGINPDLQRFRWDEKFNKAKSIDDPRMDDFLVRIFYQSFYNKVARDGANSQGISNACFQNLLPRFFPLLQGFLNYRRDRDSPTPLSFTLSVHAMLSCVLYLQGDLERVALAMKSASDKFHKQVQWAEDQKDTLNREGYRWTEHRRLLRRIRLREDASLPGIYNESLPKDVQLLAFWNPMVAGCFLNRVVFLNNIWYGAELIDSENQAISLLHIYHALKARKILQDNDIPLLSLLDSILSGSKAIWGDGKPTDEFCKNFFIASGAALGASKRMAEFIKAVPSKTFRRAIENAAQKDDFGELHEMLAEYIDATLSNGSRNAANISSRDKKALIESFCRQNFAQNIAMETDLDVARMKIFMGMRQTFVQGIRREMRLIQPEDISVSFMCMVKQDFSGIVDDCSRGNSMSALTAAGGAVTFLNWFDRTKFLQEKIMEEGCRFLGVNYIKLAWILNHAMNQLSSYMGWSQVIDKCRTGFLTRWKGSNEAKNAIVLNSLIGDNIFGELDFELDVTKCEESKRCADFLKTHFNSIPSEDTYFLPRISG
ncbi:hypothetical protein ACHAWF_005999 [Thalassiosira exigua]